MANKPINMHLDCWRSHKLTMRCVNVFDYIPHARTLNNNNNNKCNHSANSQLNASEMRMHTCLCRSVTIFTSFSFFTPAIEWFCWHLNGSEWWWWHRTSQHNIKWEKCCNWNIENVQRNHIINSGLILVGPFLFDFVKNAIYFHRLTDYKRVNLWKTERQEEHDGHHKIRKNNNISAASIQYDFNSIFKQLMPFRSVLMNDRHFFFSFCLNIF